MSEDRDLIIDRRLAFAEEFSRRLALGQNIHDAFVVSEWNTEPLPAPTSAPLGPEQGGTAAPVEGAGG